LSADALTDGFSGADLASLVREAAVSALKERREQTSSQPTSSGPLLVHNGHFHQAFGKVRPSVSAAQRKMYDRMSERLSTSRARVTDPTEPPV